MISEELILGAGVLAVAIAVTMTKKKDEKATCIVLKGYSKATLDATVTEVIKEARMNIVNELDSDAAVTPPTEEDVINDAALKRSAIGKFLENMTQAYIDAGLLKSARAQTDPILMNNDYDVIVLSSSIDEKQFTAIPNYVANVVDSAGNKTYNHCQEGPLTAYENLTVKPRISRTSSEPSLGKTEGARFNRVIQDIQIEIEARMGG